MKLLDNGIASLGGQRAQLHYLGLSPVASNQSSQEVSPGALDCLYGELSLLVENVVQHVQVYRGTQVVDVTDEDILLALGGGT